MPIDSLWVLSYSTSIGHIIVSVTSFEIFDVLFWWPWTSTVQGHPRSKVMVPNGSPLMVSYMTSIVSNIVSLTAFDIDVQVLWPRSRTVQGRPRSKMMVPIDSTGNFLFSFYWPQTSYLSLILKYLTCNFDDLQLEQFKVIQGQRSCCQSIAHELFPILRLLTQSSYLSLFCNIWPEIVMTLN